MPKNQPYLSSGNLKNEGHLFKLQSSFSPAGDQPKAHCSEWRCFPDKCKKVFTKVGVDIPVVSVLKDERHRLKDILGSKEFAQKYEKEILLANSEAHRFSIRYHKDLRSKNFLK